MKTTHALGFFLVGLFMYFSPALWPHHFTCDTSGANTSEWWLLVMGMMQMIIGTWSVGSNEVPRLMQYVARWEPVALDLELTDVGWVLSESFYVGLKEIDEISVALNLQRQLRVASA